MVHQINPLSEILALKQNQIKKIVTFCTPHLFVLILACSFVREFILRFQFYYFQLKHSTLVFEKRFSVFQNVFCKVKVLNTIKISSDFHIKSCHYLKRRAIALSVSFKMKALSQSVFLCWDKNQLKFFRRCFWIEQPFIFCLLNQSLCPLAILLKRESKQAFSCEYCVIFKNTYFEEHLWTAASVASNIKWIYAN